MVKFKKIIYTIFIKIKEFYIHYRVFFQRLGVALLTLLLAMIFGFLCIKLMPGDVVAMYARNLANSRKIPYEDAYRLAVLALNYDPNENLFVQLFNYIGSILQGDFGTSMYRDDVTVVKIIKEFMPWTLLTSGMALLISFILGVLLGGRMAVKRKGVENAISNSYIVVASAVPDYLLGMLLLILLSVRLPIFPKGGNYDIILEIEGVSKIANIMYHAALPIIAYSIVQISSWALSMRGSSIGVLGEDYIYAARMRGIPERRIRSKYIRRNALLPLITSFAISFGAIFGGAPLMEAIFNYPGFGLEFNNAIGNRDYFLILGMMVFMSFMIILANFIADSIYSLIDPRIRREV